MPYGWIDPEIYLQHNGVTVYHVYGTDDVSNGPRTYWYGTDIECAEEGDGSEYTFDVRQLPRNGHDPNTDEGRKAIIREAIEVGLVTKDGLRGEAV